jgi:AcrR family transcriptional regulator
VPAHSQYHHGDLRTAALQAARTALARDAHDPLSLRAIAREIGVTHAALYRHFPGREALLAELGTEALARLASTQRTALMTAASPIAAVEEVGLAYLRYAMRDPAQFRLAFVLSQKSAYPALRQAADAAESPALEALEGAAAAGIIASSDVRSCAVALWAMVHGMSILAIDGQLSEGGISAPGDDHTAIEHALLDGVRRLLGIAPQSGAGAVPS